MKTPLTHPRTLPRLPALFLATGFCLPLLHGADLQFSLAAGPDNAQLGSAYASVGDINGDGIKDLAVSDPSFRSGGTESASGIVYLVSGADGAAIRSYEGVPAPSQYFGLSIAALDADGDGVTDLAVGSPGTSDDVGYGAGAVRVYSGATGALLTTTTGVSSSQYGSSLANAGDQNGDGIQDLYVGAPNAGSYLGAVYVQSGRDGSILRTIMSDVSFASFGTTIATLGDIDGDGKADLAVGAPGLRTASGYNGRVSIIRSSDGVAAAQITGTGVYTRLGQSLATVADANGDGSPDLLVGSYSGGVLLLASGKDLTTLSDLSIPTLPVYQPLNAGGSVDFNGDGTQDLLIGSSGLGLVADSPVGGIRILSGTDHSTLFEQIATQSYTGLGTGMNVLPGFGFAAGESSLLNPDTAGTGYAYFWKIQQAPPVVVDSDHDGVADSADAVPHSIMTAKVSILGVDSGVQNRVDATGTTLADRYAALAPFNPKRPATYLLNATLLTAKLYNSKLVTKNEAVRLEAATAVGVVLGVLRR